MGLVLIILILTVVISLFCWYFGKVQRIRNKIKWVPTYSGVPLLGIAVDCFGGATKLLPVLSSYVEKYGGIVCVEIVMRPILLITDYNFLEFLLSSTKLITKSEDYLKFERWLGTGLLTSSGQKWKKRRRIITPAFHFSILEDFIDIFESNANILVNKLEKDVGKDSVDIYPYIGLCTLDDICETAMGTSINAQSHKNSKYVSAVKEMCRIFIDRGFSPIKMFDALYPLTFDYYTEKRLVDIIHKHTNDVISARVNELQNKKEPNTDENGLGIKKKMVFLDILLQSLVDGKPLTKEDIREEVDTFMFEGHDTTSSAIGFALYCLSKNQQAQTKAVNEQKELFGDNQNPQVTLKDLNEMKYLDAVIKETLRLYPSVPFYGRYIEEDIEYEDGKILPKGLSVFIYAYEMHRNPKYYPNPHEFNPDRFEVIDGTKPYAFIPFSAGPRNCIGQKFAMLLMKSTISKVLRNFELLPSIPEHNVILAAETVLKSANGMRLRLKKRVF